MAVYPLVIAKARITKLVQRISILDIETNLVINDSGGINESRIVC